jgi:hypothetical protein
VEQDVVCVDDLPIAARKKRRSTTRDVIYAYTKPGGSGLEGGGHREEEEIEEVQEQEEESEAERNQSSQFKGVTFDRQRSLWSARGLYQGMSLKLGNVCVCVRVCKCGY